MRGKINPMQAARLRAMQGAQARQQGAGPAMPRAGGGQVTPAQAKAMFAKMSPEQKRQLAAARQALLAKMGRR